MNQVFRNFIAAYKLPKMEVPPGNGTGYFDDGALVSKLGVFETTGGRAGVSIPISENRSIIFFERYTNESKLACNTPRQYGDPSIPDSDMSLIKTLLEAPIEARFQVMADWWLAAKSQYIDPVTLEKLQYFWK